MTTLRPFLAVFLCAIIFAATASEPLPIATRALNLLLAEKFSELHAMFGSQLSNDLPEQALRDKVGPGLKSLGKLERSGPPRVIRTAKGSDVVFQLRSASGLMGVLLSIDPAGKITGINIRKQDSGPAQQAWTNPPYSNLDAMNGQNMTIGGEPWKLPGTLLVPKGSGPFPAVVMVHGSTPFDRDEAVGPNKPFRDIAEGLASRGIAVLRYENRPHAYGPRMASIKNLTIQQEVVDDAVFAIASLRSRADIDGNRIYVLGHNVGSYIGPRIAQADTKLAGLILLAPNVSSLDDLIVDQAAAGGVPEAQLKLIRDEAAKVKTLSTATSPTFQVMGEPASYWLDLKDYHPASVAQQLSCRLFFAQGGRDFQVPQKEVAAWHSALGGKSNVMFHDYPALNHYFIPGQGKSTPAEYEKPGHVAQDLIEDLARWLSN